MIRTKSHYILFTTGKKSKTETEYIFTIYVFLTIPAPKKPPVAIGISSTAEKKNGDDPEDFHRTSASLPFIHPVPKREGKNSSSIVQVVIPPFSLL
jgi:hypothetical protein